MSRKLFLVLSLIAVSSLLLVGMYGNHTPSAVAGSPLRSALLTNVPAAQQATPTGLQAAAKSKTIPNSYIIRLADTPLAGYAGTVAGFAATTPSVTGQKLAVNSAAAKAYVSYLERQQATVLRAIERTLGTSVKVKARYQVAFNGFAVTMSEAQAALVAKLPGVLSVTPEGVRQPATDAGPAWIKAVQPDLQAALFRADLAGTNATPPITTTAKGTGIFTYDSTSQTLNYNLTLSEVITTASAGIYSGTVGVTSAVALTTLISVTPGVYIGNATLTITDEARLYAAGLYVNVTLATSPTTEIRAQIVPSKGEGVIVGIIDSGINFAHSSFADVGGDGYDHTNPKGAGKYVGACDPTNLPASPANPSGYNPLIVCNDKLIGAWTFAETAVLTDATGLPSPADEDGHGSHTASTAAGNITTANLPGIYTSQISGVAAHANIIAYDVCGFIDPLTGAVSASCPDSAILAAIDQAVVDGVDAINFSIGPSVTQNPWTDSSDYAFYQAASAGVLVSASAGNSGPTAGTESHPAPWLMSTAASTHDRKFVNTLTELAGGSTTITPTTILGKGLSVGMTQTLPIVYAGNYTDTDGVANNLCYAFNAAVDFTGKIVVCDRGTNGRVEKSVNVATAHAAGFILANAQSNGNSLTGDVFSIPGVHITYADGVILKAWLAAGSGHTGRIPGTYTDIQAANGDVMADFSSRGPSIVPNLLKPDVSAPGVDILAAGANVGAGDEFMVASGTSMASPHNTGASALIRQAHPDWSVTEVQSALMLTAVTDTLLKEDGVTRADPFDYGAGRIDVSKAVMAGLVLNESPGTMWFADPAYGGNPATFNRASMQNDTCFIVCAWTRTFSSTLATTATWTISSTGASGINFTFQPSTFEIGPFGRQTVVITADVSALPGTGAYTFDRVTLTETNHLAPAMGMPVAVLAQPSSLPASQLIQTSTISGTAVVTGVRTVAISDFNVTVKGLSKGEESNTALAPDSNPYDPFDNLSDGIYIKNVQVVSGTTRLVADIGATTAGDLDMYVIYDANGNGVIDVATDQLACQSATGTALEYCSISDPQPGLYFVFVQNFTGSGAGQDSLKLFTATVGSSSAGNFTVTGPISQSAGIPFDLNLHWNTLDMHPGDRYYGSFEAKTSATGTSLGAVAVDLRNTAPALGISKVASTSQVYLGDTVGYTLTVTTPITERVALSDPLPLGVELITNTLSAGATYNVISRTITFNRLVSGVRTITYNTTAVLTGTVANTATLSVGNETKTAFTSVVVTEPPPHASVTKVASTSQAYLGDTVGYTLTLTTPITLQVALADPLPLGANLITTTLSSGAVYHAATRTITFNRLLTDTKIITYNATMVLTGTVTNIATVTSAGVVKTATAAVLVADPPAPPTLGKVASTSQAYLDDTVGYTLTMSSAVTQTVALTDTLPPGAELIAGTLSADATYDAGSRTITFNGELAGTKTIVYSATMTLPGNVRNQATLASKWYHTNASAVVLVFDPASVSKAASTSQAYLGDTVDYSLTIIAPAPQTVALTDTLPLGVNLITGTLSSGANYDAASRTITFNGAVTDTQTITYSATMVLTGTRTNNASITARGRNAAASAIVEVFARPSVRKVASASAVGIGSTVGYTITVNTAVAESVALTDTLPIGAHLITSTLSAAANYDAASRTITFNGNVAGTQTITYSATLTQTGTITNVVALTAAGRTTAATAVVTVLEPSLVISYNSGAPGSTFVITGTYYPPNTTYEVLINGTVIAPTVTTSARGQFIVNLKTAAAAKTGRYDIQVRLHATARQATDSVGGFSYTLDTTKPIRSGSSTGVIVNVPTTIAPILKYVFLPTISR